MEDDMEMTTEASKTEKRAAAARTAMSSTALQRKTCPETAATADSYGKARDLVWRPAFLSFTQAYTLAGRRLTDQCT